MRFGIFHVSARKKSQAEAHRMFSLTADQSQDSNQAPQGPASAEAVARFRSLPLKQEQESQHQARLPLILATSSS